MEDIFVLSWDRSSCIPGRFATHFGSKDYLKVGLPHYSVLGNQTQDFMRIVKALYCLSYGERFLKKTSHPRFSALKLKWKIQIGEKKSHCSQVAVMADPASLVDSCSALTTNLFTLTFHSDGIKDADNNIWWDLMI